MNKKNCTYHPFARAKLSHRNNCKVVRSTFSTVYSNKNIARTLLHFQTLAVQQALNRLVIERAVRCVHHHAQTFHHVARAVSVEQAEQALAHGIFRRSALVRHVHAEARDRRLSAHVARSVGAPQRNDGLVRPVRIHLAYLLHEPTLRWTWGRDKHRRHIFEEGQWENELLHPSPRSEGRFVDRLPVAFIASCCLKKNKKKEKVR